MEMLILPSHPTPTRQNRLTMNEDRTVDVTRRLNTVLDRLESSLPPAGPSKLGAGGRAPTSRSPSPQGKAVKHGRPTSVARGPVDVEDYIVEGEHTEIFQDA
jgi:hypothetical protein